MMLGFVAAGLVGCASDATRSTVGSGKVSTVGSPPGPLVSGSVGCGSDPVAAAVAFVRAVQADDREAYQACLGGRAEMALATLYSLQSSTLELSKAAVGPFTDAREDEIAVHVPAPDGPGDTVLASGEIQRMPPHASGFIVVATPGDDGNYVVTEVEGYTST